MRNLDIMEMSHSKDLNEAAQEAFESYECVEWERKPEDEYAFKVGFLHGVMWMQERNIKCTH